MKIKLFYETLKGEKKYTVSSMKNVMGGTTYFDFVSTFKRCDNKIKEDFIVVVYNDENKIIHKENVHLNWICTPNENKWSYGITICGKRVVSEVIYGYFLPICHRDRERHWIDVQMYDKDGCPMYDKDGCPMTTKQYCSCSSKIMDISSTKFPKGVLHNFSKTNYSI